MINQVILLVILVLINAFFASVEIAFISLNDLKLKSDSKKGNKKAKDILHLLNNPSSFLATIQIGITLAGFLSSAFASEAFAEELGPLLYDFFPSISLGSWETISIVVVTIILSFFMLVFGELVPKRVALKYDEKIAYMAVGIIKIISCVTRPFVILLTGITNVVSKLFGVSGVDEEHITEEEIRLVLDQGREKGAIKKYEHSFIHNVFVKDIFKNISNEKIILKDIMHKPLFVSSKIFVNEVFTLMKDKKSHIAIVMNNDEYLGIISMKDVLEEIVGDIEDEYGM